MANVELRRLARAEGIPLWKIAEALKISEPTMTRKMRHELPEKEAEKIKTIIAQLKEDSINEHT